MPWAGRSKRGGATPPVPPAAPPIHLCALFSIPPSHVGRTLHPARAMPFDPALDVTAATDPLGFRYGPGVRGPKVEVRTLDAVRPSLRDPGAEGPDELYAIAMDVRDAQDEADLAGRHLLFGVVTYAAGTVGEEPVRSQGHVHAVSPRSGRSTPEVYEVWAGRAVVLMQERCEAGLRETGRCFAVEAGPGGVVVVPPGWAHATVSADPAQPLTFGAWCDRAYGFVYDGVRAHGGLAWFPVVDGGGLRWEPNPTYDAEPLVRKGPEPYAALGLEPGVPVYEQYRRDRGRFDFVPDPGLRDDAWRGFVP